MSELGERYELSLAHLALGLFYERALFWGEHIVRINDAAGLNEHAILLFCKRNKISLLNVEGFEHFPRNDHLAPLAHAADPRGVSITMISRRPHTCPTAKKTSGTRSTPPRR